MKTQKIINGKNIQSRSPISFGLLIYLLLDKWNTPLWVYGAIGMLLLIWFISWIVDFMSNESIDIFEDWEGSVGKSRFQQKLNNLKNKSI